MSLLDLYEYDLWYNELDHLELGLRTACDLYDENDIRGWAPKYETIVMRGYLASYLRRWDKSQTESHGRVVLNDQCLFSRTN